METLIETLKVASAQFHTVDNDFDGNMAKAEKMVRKVMTESSVDLLLFCEVCIEGVDLFNFETNLTRETLDKIDQFWVRMAKTSGINILTGRVAKRDGVWRNLAVCYAPDGTIRAEYAKTHLYNQERNFFKPGDEKIIFDLKGFRIGVMICADLGFPELSRAMAVKGVDLFAVPSCWGYPHDMLWVLCNQMRAAENGCYLISSNRVGTEISGRVTVGRSMLSSPSGEILANLGLTDEGYFVHTLQKEHPAASLPVCSWLDWIRPELYKL